MDAAWTSPHPARLHDALGRRLLALTMCLMAAIGLLLLIRRYSGDLREPLAPAELVLLSLHISLVAVLLRKLWWRTPKQRTTLWQLLIGCLPSVGTLAGGIALSLPESSSTALAAFWGILIGGELLGWLLLSRRSWAVKRRALTTVEPGSLSLPPACVPSRLAGDVSQWVVRGSDQPGQESIVALLRAAFVRGERSQTLHLAFCPPLPGLPEVVVEQREGPQANIKLTHVQTFGARLDLRLSAEPEEASTVVVQLQARAKG